MTNKDFTSQPAFVNACKEAGTSPTARQASKYRRKRGLAFTVGLPRLVKKQEEANVNEG